MSIQRIYLPNHLRTICTVTSPENCYTICPADSMEVVDEVVGRYATTPFTVVEKTEDESLDRDYQKG